jgi:serine/threonine protein phosphatase PrpC
MLHQVGFKTDIGRKRAQNQDACSVHPEIGLYIVADGMGGHRGGETASATAVEVITSDMVHKKNSGSPAEILKKSIEDANAAIFEKALHDPKLQGMGTTTTALYFNDFQLIIGHVGDSRCYFIRPNGIWQMTRDHSLVQEKLRAGLINREDAKNDRMKNVITRSVGFEKDVNVEIYQMTVQIGDSFLICSDGLSGLLEDTTILQIVQKQLFEAGQVQKAVDDLIDAANVEGGDDNITSVLIQVCE